MYILELPLDHPSLNSWLAGNSHWKRSNLKKKHEEELMWHLKASNWPKPLPVPFGLTVVVQRKRPYDVDNCIISGKYMLDTLKQLGYIENDGIDFCPAMTLLSEKGKENKVIYRLTPILQCDTL